jgi:hypothetical protein
VRALLPSFEHYPNCSADYDAAIENVVSCSSAALMLLGLAATLLLPLIGAWSGCVLALLASMYYFRNQEPDENVPSIKADDVRHSLPSHMYTQISA